MASGNVGTFDNIKCLFDVHVILYRVIVGNGSEFTAQIISDLKELWPELVIVDGNRATHRVEVVD
jgi:hypothetical protein